MLLSLLVPYLPPLDDASVAAPSIVVAQAETASSNPDMTLGNCEDVQSPDNPNGPLGGSLQPAGTLRNYWASKFNEVLSINDAKITVLDGPMHGKIEGQWLSKTGGPSFAYVADPGFLGQDKITFLVEVGGKSIKVVTTLIVVKVAGLHGSPCFSGIKRISSSETPNLTNGLASGLTTDQLAGILSAAAGVTVTISDLPGAAVGQSTGTTITRDTNAASNGWFIEYARKPHSVGRQ